MRTTRQSALGFTYAKARAITVSLALAATACRSDRPVLEAEMPQGQWAATPIRCSVTRAGATCGAGATVTAATSDAAASAASAAMQAAASTALRPLDAVFGGGDVFLRFVTTAASYDAGTGTLLLELRIQNLLTQAMGTSDGVTGAVDAIRVGLVDNPPVTTAGTGTVTLTNPDGTATIGAPGVAYVAYPGPLAAAATSGPRSWRFDMPSTVQAFDLRLLVLAPVPDESPAAFASAPSNLWTDVAAGTNVTCAVRGGQSYCWGQRSVMLPGDGTAGFSALPQPVTGLPTATQVAVGGTHACALTTVGEIWCWGNNTVGQLGAGSVRTVSRPLQVVAPSGTVFTQVSASGGGTCALDTAGALWCWGSSISYRNGDSTLVDRPVATRVRPGGAVTFASVASARTISTLTPPINQGACAVATDARVFCWGLNVGGRFGVGAGVDTLRAPAPTATNGGAIWAQAAVGADHACYRATTGAVSCAGAAGPELGDGLGDVARNTPTAVAGGRLFATISAGRDFTCGVEQATRAAYCWGLGTGGTLGNGGTSGSPLPVLVSGGLQWDDVVAGGGGTACGRTTSGEVHCWGRNESAEAGRGSDLPVRRFVLSPLRVDAIPPAQHLDVGANAACAVAGGTVYCWGELFNGTASGGIPYQSQGRPTGVLQGPTAVSRVLVGEGAAARYACVTGVTVGMRCWGTATGGVLGDGLAAVPASGGLRDVLTSAPIEATAAALPFGVVAGGPLHACGVEGALPQRILCWGTGLIGNGNTVNTAVFSTPQAAGAGEYVDVAISNSNTCAITSDFALACWGPADVRLGRTGPTDTPTPTLLSTPGLLWDDIDGGPDGFCAVTVTGLVYCWGNNANGAMGRPIGTEPTVPVPTLVDGTLTGITGSASRVAVGTGVACASQLARVSCWGTRIPDRDNTLTNSTTAPIIFTTGVVSHLAAGDGHVCLIQAGLLSCAGRNNLRQLGVGSTATALAALQPVLPP